MEQARMTDDERLTDEVSFVPRQSKFTRFLLYFE
jgi:hypothetical protein